MRGFFYTKGDPMNYEYLSISELKPAERNARRHQEKDIEAIKKKHPGVRI